MSNYSHREDAGAGERLLGAVRRNPEGLLLLAAGAALLDAEFWNRSIYP